MTTVRRDRSRDSSPGISSRRVAVRIPALLLCLIAAPALAQQSAGFQLEDHSLNSGGTTATSASFRITLDALGAPVARTSALSAASYRMDIGLVPAYRPAGEVAALTIGPSKSELHWSAEPSAGDYAVYRESLATLSGTAWGSCLQSGLATTTADDPADPASGAGYFYLVSARNRLGEQGSLGETSNATVRTPASACP